MEELDSIKKTLDVKTSIGWLKEILILEMWEEELFQGGDVSLPPSDDMEPTIASRRSPSSDSRSYHQGVSTFFVEW